MKTLVALTLATLMAAPTFVQSAAAAPSRHDVFSQSDQMLGNSEDLTQVGPVHRGPLYHGYPLSDWYIYD
jgi:hypothetical protein